MSCQPSSPLLSQIACWLGLTVLSSLALFVYLFAHGAPNLAAAQPMLLYAGLPLLLALPFDVLYAPSRFFFLTTLGRMLLPLQPITFPDFFVADVLTSMSKVLSDVERAGCRMLNGQASTDRCLGSKGFEAKAGRSADPCISWTDTMIEAFIDGLLHHHAPKAVEMRHRKRRSWL